VDHAVRQQAQSDVGRSLVVEASAGTGKTTLLVARVLHIVARREVPIEKIVAITFTEKAAAELRVRIREALEREIAEPSGVWSAAEVALFARALADLALANISTIHAFASSLLRERPVEAHVDPGFATLDALNATMMIDEVWERWEEAELLASAVPYHRALAAGVTRERVRTLARELLENRDLYAPLAYAEGAEFDFDTEARALAEAAAALERRAGEERRAANDALALHVRELSAGMRAMAAGDESERGARLGALKVRKAGRLGRKENWNPHVLEEMREAVGALGERLASLRAGVAADVARWLGGFLAAYEEEKTRRGVLDFADLLLLARNLLRDHLHVRADFIARFDAILVDEFQDTDPLQAEIVLFLSEAEARAAGWRDVVVAPGRLFVVGDPKQSIYRFRRADLEVYEDVRDRVAGGTPLTITQNFRSVPGIAAWVNTLFERLFAETAGAGARIRYAPIVAERAAGAAPAVLMLAPPASMEAGIGADEVRAREANAIAETIAAGIDDGWARPRDVAILFRALTDVQAYEDALDARGIAYQVEGGKAFFERPEVAAFLSCIAAIDDPEDAVALVAALRTPHFGISDEALALFAASGGRLRYLDDPGAAHPGIAEAFALLRDLHARRYHAPLHAVAERVLDETRVLEFHALHGRGRRAVANLEKLVEKARAFETLGAATLRAFVHWIREEARENIEDDSPIAEESDDLVTLMSIHRAKGLQYSVVALANLHGGRAFSDGFLKEARTGRIAFTLGDKDHPIRTARFDETRQREVAREREEGKRILYVAATRARDVLVVPAYGALLKASEIKKRPMLLDLLSALPDPREWRDGAELAGMRVRVTAGEGAEGASAVARALQRGARETAASLVDESAWLAERDAAIARGASRLPAITSRAPSPPPPASRDGAEEESARDAAAAGDTARDRAAGLGRFVHEVMNVLPRLDAAALDEVAREVAAAEGAGREPAQMRDALAILRALLSDEAVDRARRAPRCHREIAFSASLDGVLAEGRIDLLFEEAGGIVFVDYKTSRLDAHHGATRDALRAFADAQGHLSQAILYAHALRAMGFAVREGVFLYPRAGARLVFTGDELLRAPLPPLPG